MKKFLCVLLSLCLVLSMSGMATATSSGELVDGSNTIELPWESKESSIYTYTATQTGTLYISTTAFFSAEGDYKYSQVNEKNMYEWEWYTQLTVDGQLLEGLYFGSIEVVEGQTYTFSWSHLPELLEAKWYKMGWRAEIELSYSDEAVPQLGSETLPVELYTEQCPADTIEIAPGATVYYLLYDFGGANFTVAGENAYVVVSSFNMDTGKDVVVRYKPEDGVVTVPVENNHTTIQIGNAGKESAVFALDYYYPQGSKQNPQELVIGENVAVTEKENWDGYNFTWTAECSGTLTLTMPGGGWMGSVQNRNVDRWAQWYDPSLGNVIAVAVSAGDVVVINVNSFNGAIVTGGDVIFTASVTYSHEYVDGKCTHCGAEEVQNQLKLGDVNGDGDVNTRDARLLLRYIAQLVDESEINRAVADINEDGDVNTRDARLLLRKIAGLA